MSVHDADVPDCYGDSPDPYKSLPLQLRTAAMQELNNARATGLRDSADAIVDRAIALRESITLENMAALQSAVSRGYYHFVRLTPLGDNNGGGAMPIEQERKAA